MCGCAFDLTRTEEFWEHVSKWIISILLTIILCFCTFVNISDEFYLDILMFLVNIFPNSLHRNCRLMRYFCGCMTIDTELCEVLCLNGTFTSV